MLHAFVTCSMHATCPAQPVPDLPIPGAFIEQYKSWSS